MLRTGFLLIFLLLCSCWDIRERKLPFWLLLAGLAGGILLTCCEKGMNGRTLWFLVCGCLPGFLVCVAAYSLPGQIGAGDGWMLLTAGVTAGWQEGLLLLEYGLFLLFPAAFFWGVIKKRRKKELPLAPFLLGGYLWQLLCRGG